jgi:hypothetical protein
MYDWIGAIDIIEQDPDKEYIRCCIDMKLSIPELGHWVVVPGNFISEGKPDDMKFDEYFEPISEGISWDGTIPEDWLLVATYHDRFANEEEMKLANIFIIKFNQSRLLEH